MRAKLDLLVSVHSTADSKICVIYNECPVWYSPLIKVLWSNRAGNYQSIYTSITLSHPSHLPHFHPYDSLSFCLYVFLPYCLYVSLFLCLSAGIRRISSRVCATFFIEYLCLSPSLDNVLDPPFCLSLNKEILLITPVQLGAYCPDKMIHTDKIINKHMYIICIHYSYIQYKSKDALLCA